MIIDLPPKTAQIIQHGADIQGVSIEQFIINSAYSKAIEIMPSTWHISDNEAELLNRLADDSTPANNALKDLLALTSKQPKKQDNV